MINLTIFTLKLSVSHLWIVMFLFLRLMEFICLISFDLIEYLAMLQNLTLTIMFLLGNFLIKVIGIMNFAIFFSKLYRRCYDCNLNSMSDLDFPCAGDCQSQSYIVPRILIKENVWHI